MSGRWQAGQLALVLCSDGEYRPATFTPSDGQIKVDHWSFPDGTYRHVDSSEARPLVVINPDDRESVLRLGELIRKHSPWTDDAPALHLTDALREFANPTPPKPDEPPPWSVVIVADNTPFTRTAKEHITPPYQACWFGEHPISGERTRLTWGELHALGDVRVVGMGVTA